MVDAIKADILIMQFVEINNIIHMLMSCDCSADHLKLIQQGIAIRAKLLEEIKELYLKMGMN